MWRRRKRVGASPPRTRRALRPQSVAPGLAAAGAGATTGSHLTADGHIVVAGAGAHVQIGDATSQPLSSLHQLPSPPAAFTGRDEELADLEQKLASAQSAGVTISAAGPQHAGLQGTPGVGKTALAIVLAHR